MLDKVKYWLDLCDEDISVAKSLINSKHYLQAGFFCHLVAEKALKAVIESVTRETPPKTHDLMKLALKAGFFDSLPEDSVKLLKELQPLQIEARYPDYKATIAEMMTNERTKRIFKETEEFLCWIKQRLDR